VDDRVLGQYDVPDNDVNRVYLAMENAASVKDMGNHAMYLRALGLLTQPQVRQVIKQVLREVPG
jgi:hypothetical protein